MNEQTIDLEKDNLVVYRHSDGKFQTFQWITHDKHSAEEVAAKIIEFNGTKQIAGYERTAEMITDQLIREICAYAYKKLQEKEQEKSDESGKEEARRKIERALELLEDAKDCLE